MTEFEHDYDVWAIIDWAEAIKDANSYGEAARLTKRLIQQAREMAEPDLETTDDLDLTVEEPAEDPKGQRPGESDKKYAKRLGYGKNDFGAPGYDRDKRDTTWDNYSIGDRYMDH